MKRKSLANSMMRADNFLVDLDSIPDDLVNLSESQVRFYIRNVLSVYIMFNKNLKSFFIKHRTVIVLRFDQRGANRRALLLILRLQWIIVCRVYHVFLSNINIYV